MTNEISPTECPRTLDNINKDYSLLCQLVGNAQLQKKHADQIYEMAMADAYPKMAALLKEKEELERS